MQSRKDGEPESITLHFYVDKETPGAFRYRECDSSGKFVNAQDAYIGTIYVRKSKLSKGRRPVGWSMAIVPFYE